MIVDADNFDENAAQTGFADQDAASIDDGWALYGRLAVLRHLGTDTPMHSIEYRPSVEELPAVEFERLSTIGRSTLGIFVADCSVDEELFVEFAESDPRLYTLRLDRSYNHDASILALTMITPALEPLTPRYERNSDIGSGDGMMFTEDTVDDSFVDHPDGGDKLLADRVFLLDPEVAEPMVAGISFADVSRVGIPAYLAELQIDLHTVEAADSFFAEDGAESRNFAIAEDRSHIDRALRAVNAAKAARDTVLISFAPKRLAQMGDNLSEVTTYDGWVAEVL